MAVWWLGFQTLTAEGLGSIPGQETKILLASPCDKSRHCIEKQRHRFIDNGLYGQSYVFFSNSHVRIQELDHQEGWVPKDWCFWIVVLEKTLKSPLDSKEIKPVHPKGNQPWIFTGRTGADAEGPIFLPLDAKSQLIGEDPDAGKDWRQQEKAVAEDEVVR